MVLFMIEIVIMVILYKHVAVTAYRARRMVRPLSNAHILAGINPSTSNSGGGQGLPKGEQSTDITNTSQGQNTRSLDNISTSESKLAKATVIFSVKTSIRNIGRRQSSRDDLAMDYRRNYTENRNFSSRLKAAKMLFFVTAVFFLSWMPFFIIRISASINPYFWNDKSNTKLVIEQMLNHIFYLNNAVNPIIYTIINKNFRIDCKRLFRKHCGTARR
jgi:hypothetical protein